MQQLHRALRDLNREIASVSMVAERYGYRDLGRLATNYRAIYSELRSGDLRRASRPEWRSSLSAVPRTKLS
jgi:AraC-like DNA-binding protein